MDSERLFSLANTLILPGWFLLFVLPRWRYTANFIASILIPGLLAIAYLVLFAKEFDTSLFSAFNTLAGVRGLFENDSMLLAGWIHYLAFDLFVGSWEVRDARALGIPHIMIIPSLFLTLMAGPVGFLTYLGLRLAMRGRWTIEDAGNAMVSG
jgi:hypothetical protein